MWNLHFSNVNIRIKTSWGIATPGFFPEDRVDEAHY
jgi:hypothetical protein